MIEWLGSVDVKILVGVVWVCCSLSIVCGLIYAYLMAPQYKHMNHLYGRVLPIGFLLHKGVPIVVKVLLWPLIWLLQWVRFAILRVSPWRDGLKPTDIFHYPNGIGKNTGSVIHPDYIRMLAAEGWKPLGIIAMESGFLWVGDPFYVATEDAMFPAARTWPHFLHKMGYGVESKHRSFFFEKTGAEGLGWCCENGFGEGCAPVFGRVRTDGSIQEIRILLHSPHEYHPYIVTSAEAVSSKLFEQALAKERGQELPVEETLEDDLASSKSSKPSK